MLDRGTVASGAEALHAPALTDTLVRSLATFWDEARLRADDATSTSIRPAAVVVPWRTALEALLHVGYGLQTQCRFVDGAWEQVRWRTTPSAGALYPFEVIACVVGEGSYVWDVGSSRLLACNLAPLTADAISRIGLAAGDDRRVEALLVVVARPWLSMQKYRQRGYSYCHLDVGHVTSNLAMYSAALDCAPVVHLRFSRGWLAECLGLGGLCREPLAVLSFGSAPGGGRGRRVEAESPDTRLVANLEPPGFSESQNWESLTGIRSFDSSIAFPCPPASMPLVREPAHAHGHDLIPLPDGMPLPSTAVEWRSAVLTRRSAKGFQHRALDIRQIGLLLAALRADGLRADCSSRDAIALGVRLVAANVNGLTGVFAYSPTRHALCRLDSVVDDLGAACMKQRTAIDAAAMLLFHAPRSRVLGGYSAFAETHFHAAQLGQRLHMAASRLDGVGMSCIGGFDGERCAALARLLPADEPVYVILLGVPNDSAVKDDQLRVAFSHGFATEEG